MELFLQSCPNWKTRIKRITSHQYLSPVQAAMCFDIGIFSSFRFSAADSSVIRSRVKKYSSAVPAAESRAKAMERMRQLA